MCLPVIHLLLNPILVESLFRDDVLFTMIGQVEQGGISSDIQILIDRQEEQIQRAVLFALVPVVVAFSFIVFVIYRSRRESFFRQKEAELRVSIIEGELKALRAQINPHFIFNCLNSIHHYMHKNEIARASGYLIKFSKLIRHVLETSSMRTIPLEDELEAVRHYIELEQLRMDQSFDFTIEVAESIDASSISIPPMLIQPFVENSIWHGMNKVPSRGVLIIKIVPKDGQLIDCIIEDNGSDAGEKSPLDLSHSVKKTSLGLSLMNERFSAIAKLFNIPAGFVITDKVDAQGKPIGKRVTVSLPFED